MSTIISKHKIKLLKLFLVSPTLEKVFLFIYVVTVILLSLSNKFGNHISNYALGKQFMNIINKDAINSATDITDIANWITNDLVPAYFTDQVTVNKPLFPIYLLKSQIQCSSSDSAADCSVINRNLNTNSGQSQIIKNIKGHYGTYAISDVYQIDRDINSTALATLNTYLQGTWLDSSGTFVAVQLVCYNDWNQVYIEFSISFEWSTPDQIVARNIAYDISSPGLMHESYFVIFFSFFVIQLIISVMKVLFEFSISPNRFTFAGHLAHFTVQAVYAITVAVTLQQDKLTTAYSDSLQSFASIQKSIKNMTITNLLLNLLIIFYPFRLFTLLAWNKYLATPIKLFVVLYRTIPGIMIFGLAFMTLWVCFSLASYFGLREYLVQVQSYKASFLNYFTMDFSNTAIDNTILNSSELTTFQITWALNSLALGGLLFFAVAIIVDMIRRSFDQEVPAELPHQQELQAKQTELEIKFDKFLKELSSIFGLKNKDKNASSFSSEEKMVIWLEHKMGFESEGDDVIEQLSLSKDPIKIMVFYKPEEVEEFLKYLFRLKPNLLTSQAGSKFRIVYETKFEKVNSEKNNIETLLDWLKGVGCRVPFLLFTKAELERDTYIHIKKKYPALFVTEEKAGALKFCRMEGKLDNLGFKLESNDNKYIMLENSVSDISVGVTSRSSIE